jgi:L-aspartate-alpha-decarboxylase
MLVQILKSKILRAETTDSILDYEGSLAIDEELMNRVGLLYGEKILVGNITNGNRFETYAIPAPADSKTFSLRGAAAHMGKKGDLLVLMSFAMMTEEEAKRWVPRTMTLADGNSRIIKEQNIL